MVNFPTSLDDSSTLPDPGAASYTNNPSHLGLHGNENAAIKALEAKVGISVSTPPGSNYILTSTSTGNSVWAVPPNSAVWGLVTGTLSTQTDLQAALTARLLLGGGTMTGLLTLSADPAANLGAATKQYVDALGSTTLVRNETPGGAINGSNTAYTTAATYATGSLKVYLNGQRLTPGAGIDYVEVTQGFTMQYTPATGDVLLVDYETTNTTRFIQGSNSIIVQETPTGTVNSTTTLFTTLQSKYVANTLEVFINGIAQLKTTDYTETSPSSGTFTFTTAPLTGDAVRVNYQFSTGASGNADTVDGIHASATATANNIVPLDSNAKLPVTLLTNPYKFSVYCSTNAALGNNVASKVPLDTKNFDTSTNFDATTNYRFVAPIAGFYCFSAKVVIGTAGISSTAYAIGYLFKNGVEVSRGQQLAGSGSTTTQPSPQMFEVLQLIAGDYIEIWALCSEASRAIQGGNNYTYLRGFLLSVT